MAYAINPITGRQVRGFGAMDAAKRREIARKGGSGVPADKRSFYVNRELATTAGMIGGLGNAARFPRNPR